MTARETRARACESTMAWHRRPPRGVRVGPFCMLAFSFGAVRDGRGLKVSTTGGRHGQLQSALGRTVYVLFVIMAGAVWCAHWKERRTHPEPHARTTT